MTVGGEPGGARAQGRGRPRRAGALPGRPAAGRRLAPQGSRSREPVRWNTATTTRSSGCPARPARPRSRRRSVGSRASTIRTGTRATRPPSSGSRTSTRPTRSCRIPTKRKQYDLLGANWEQVSRAGGRAGRGPVRARRTVRRVRRRRRRERPLRVPHRGRRGGRVLRLLPHVLRRSGGGCVRRPSGGGGANGAGGASFEDILAGMGGRPAAAPPGPAPVSRWRPSRGGEARPGTRSRRPPS